jgi:hypothetical protein
MLKLLCLTFVDVSVTLNIAYKSSSCSEYAYCRLLFFDSISG